MTRREKLARLALLLIVATVSVVVWSYATRSRVLPRRDWYPSIAKFFKYVEDGDNAPDQARFDAFSDLFTPEARGNFIANRFEATPFISLHADASTVASVAGAGMPWPGHFRRFVPGLGRFLAAVEFDKDGRSAIATTMVSREHGDLRLDEARLYRFTFEKDGSKWKIAGFEFVRRDPTISNVQPAYVYTVAGFVVFNALALLPFLFPPLFVVFPPKVLFRWTLGWYGPIFALYIKALEKILDFRKALLHRIWAPLFTLVICPLAFLGLVGVFTYLAPRTFNSHVGFLMILLLVAAFMSLAILKEVFDYYHAKAAGIALWDRRRDPVGIMLGRRKAHFEFDAATYKRVSVFLVLMVMAAGIAGFLPYRKKFRVSAISETELVFSVESHVETAVETRISRLPSVQDQYQLTTVGAGEIFPMIEEVNSQEGIFYRVAFSRRSIGYVPADAVEQIDRTVTFRLEGNYINYLEELGGVLEVSDPPPEFDPEARTLANAFLDEATRGIRKADLRSLTRAINDINQAIEFDPAYGDLYLHRAVALAGIGRFLRDDTLHNAFGLTGDTVANPDKVNVLFYRARQNLETADRLGVDAAASNAVKALIEIYRGRPSQAMPAEVPQEGRHPYVLLSRIYRASDPIAAIEEAEALLRLEPDNVQAINDRGVLLATQNRTAARTAFDQAARLNEDFIEGRTNLATSKLTSERGEGLRELSGIIDNELDFTHRARLSRNFFRINAIALVFFPLAAIVLIVGIINLARKEKMERAAVRSSRVTSVRLGLLFVMLLILSFQSVEWTLPTYGTVGPLLPPLLALIG